ncbi:mitochondrial 2-oxoglutarate/malate carrier protein-like [Diorhabda sublineata]|uniref:mitochondrial 2-oxoglutarate/malate carrier protein-like n=1 Tax=Diorhabda sublineata TaxID=1163346 RepID=UPI0024E17283|nr:mitochondrial 2-oxoglutarate/malate carrier protein-like [Diorhabda sublineata]
MSEQRKIPNFLKFLFGAAAGMAGTCIVHPLDLIKNRMQLSGMGGAQKEYRNMFHAMQIVGQREGLPGFYRGLSAGLLRQVTYTGTRLGVYTYLFERFKSYDGKPPGFLTKVAIGMFAGLSGAFVGTPAEVSLIRMTADGRLPIEERRNYAGVSNALIRIYREEGLFTLWKGATPTMGRAIAVNAAQLGTYSQAKEMVASHMALKEGIGLHFLAAMISGFITSIVSMPLDIAKTRLQNMKTVGGKAEFKGPVDVLIQLKKKEGFFALWKGFLPYYLRIGPHTVFVFIFLEQFNRAYFKFKYGDSGTGSGSL